MRLNYSIAIATRNRPDALRLSIPRMLNQSRKPSQLIVIDSSDDHEIVKKAVKKAVNDHPVKLTIKHSEKGLTKQRNAALAHVEHPIVFFPDDDSIWFQKVAEKQMEVYERDVENRIAAVCAAESPFPPQDFESGENNSYSMRKGDRFKQRFAHIRAKLEKLFIPDPAILVGKKHWESFSTPDWFNKEDIVPVEWMTGFRMSFRTNVIKNCGFDEAFQAYSLFEDIDASFAAWKSGAVVGARQAKVFHFKSPERRDNGKRLGFEQLVNKAYVVAKHTDNGDPIRLRMKRFAKYKILQYRLAANDQFGRDRLEGAKNALAEIPTIMNCPQGKLRQQYSETINRIHA